MFQIVVQEILVQIPAQILEKGTCMLSLKSCVQGWTQLLLLDVTTLSGSGPKTEEEHMKIKIVGSSHCQFCQ